MTFGGPTPGSAPTVDRQPAPLTSGPTSQARGQRARCQTRHRRTSHSRPPRTCSNATPKDSHGATTTVSTWALHVIAVEATWCARREVHVQVERKDAGGHRARDWHTDGSAAARPTVRAGHQTCATAVGKAQSTPEGACFTAWHVAA